MTYMSSEKWPKNSTIFKKFKKKTNIFLNCILKKYRHFHNYVSKTGKCVDISEQNSMRWIFLSWGGLRVSNFRTITYVTFEEKREWEREGGESLPLLASKVIRNCNSNSINLAYFIYKQCRISRNALFTKVHCRSYTSLILKYHFPLTFIYPK